MDDVPATSVPPLSVGALAKLGGITVRTLHHYDELGLLTPSERTGAGYRAYSAGDVARLQRILFYRELELPLDRIRQLLDDPEADERDHLRRQHALLGERIDRLQRIRDAVQTTLEAHEMSIDLTPAERLEVFGDHDPAQYEDEVRERWGDTDAYRQSQQRSARYTKDDWKAIRAEQEEIGAAFAQLLRAGAPADGEAAMDAAERARLQIDRRFYACSHDMHRRLADMYLADPRFTAHYEDQADGLAQYVHDAIHANGDRAGAAAG